MTELRKVISTVGDAGAKRIGENVLRWASQQSFCQCGFANIELYEIQGVLHARCTACGLAVEVEPQIVS